MGPVSILLWLVFGALAGWIASLIMGTSRSQGLALDIVMGILGALIGGFLASNFLGRGVTNNPFDLVSLAIAVAGAIILSMIVRAAAGRRI